MDTREIISVIADIHNDLSEISVRGDDTIRMAGVIQKCRNIVFAMQKELNQTEKEVAAE